MSHACYWNPFGQLKFAYRPVADSGSIEDQAVGGVGIHIGGQRDQIPVVFTGTGCPRSHRGVASVDAVTEPVAFFASGEEVMLDPVAA
jgi:hypothetical protein